jgi:hypothetical protein
MEIVETPAKRHAQPAVVLEPPPSLQQLLCAGLIFPEVRQRNTFFDFGKFDFGSGSVKDGSAGR